MTGRRGLAFLLAALPFLLLVLGLAATYRPTWYRPASVDWGRLRADKEALASLQDEVSAALNSGLPARFRLDEDQLNRWLAARGEIWPESETPAGERFRYPQLLVRKGTIRVAATGTAGRWRAVFAVSGRVAVTEASMTVHCDSVRLGVLPLPRGRLAKLLAGWPAIGDVGGEIDRDGTVRLLNDWVWPNGKRRFRVSEARISDGVLEVVLEPLAGGRP